jgi:hypothetical protein
VLTVMEHSSAKPWFTYPTKANCEHAALSDYGAYGTDSAISDLHPQFRCVEGVLDGVPPGVVTK